MIRAVIVGISATLAGAVIGWWLGGRSIHK